MNTAKTAFMVMATIILTALLWAPLSAEQDPAASSGTADGFLVALPRPHAVLDAF